jgi:hypothetical protein
MASQILIVRDDNNRCAVGAVNLMRGFEHALGRFGIKITGRLIGQNKGWIHGEHANYGNALLLTAVSSPTANRKRRPLQVVQARARLDDSLKLAG